VRGGKLPRSLTAGEVIELRGGNISSVIRELYLLRSELRHAHLQAVPVDQLLAGSGTPV
jgi:hypothetical protein